MTFIPSEISAAGLEFYANQAKEREEAERNGEVNDKSDEGERVHDGKTHQELIDLAQKHMDLLYEECKSPMIHKVMAMIITHRLMKWHVDNSRTQVENDRTESALAWAADAGKFRVALDTLRQISICEDDFTYRPDNNGDFLEADDEDDND